jgi:hypothetical protein
MSLLLLLRGSDIAGEMAATEAADSAHSAYWSDNYWHSGYWAASYWYQQAPITGAVLTGIVSGALDFTDVIDVAALSGVVQVSGTLSRIDSIDAAEITAKLLASAALVATDGTDAVSIAASALITAALVASDAADSEALEGDIYVSGSFARTSGTDAASFAGGLFDAAGDIEGTLDATEAPDTLTSTNVVAAPQTGGGAAQRAARAAYGPGLSPRRQPAAIVVRLDATERPDRAEISAWLDWSADDEELLLMSDAA